LLSEQRQKLHSAQMALALALRGTAAAPNGFDQARLGLACSALRSKRLHAAARAWPALEQALGQSFARLFADYAANFPTPSTPTEDAIAFARFLAARQSLPKALRRAVRLERVREFFSACFRPTT